MNKSLVTGMFLLGIHTAIAVLIYFSVESSKGVAQAEFIWFFLMFVDYPAIYIGYEWFGGLFNIFERNLKALLIFSLFGGLQWFLIGYFGAFALIKLRGANSNEPEVK